MRQFICLAYYWFSATRKSDSQTVRDTFVQQKFSAGLPVVVCGYAFAIGSSVASRSPSLSTRPADDLYRYALFVEVVNGETNACLHPRDKEGYRVMTKTMTVFILALNVLGVQAAFAAEGLSAPAVNLLKDGQYATYDKGFCGAAVRQLQGHDHWIEVGRIDNPTTGVKCDEFPQSSMIFGCGTIPICYLGTSGEDRNEAFIQILTEESFFLSYPSGRAATYFRFAPTQ